MVQGSNTGRDKNYFSSLKVNTGSGGHPASYSMSIGVLSRGYRVRYLMLTSHIHPAPRLSIRGAIALLLAHAFMM